jgi:hypothetical protein
MQVRIIGISRGSIRIWGISTAISEEPQVIVNERDRMGAQFPEPVRQWLLSEEVDTA